MASRVISSAPPDHDELGHPVTVHLDAFGRAVRKSEPLDAGTVVTDYEYDTLGRLTGITDDAGNHWAYTHDSLGRTLTVDDPDLGVWTKTYDDAGQLFTQTDALIRPGETTGQATRFTYDALGRMLTKTARFGAPGCGADHLHLRRGRRRLPQCRPADPGGEPDRYPALPLR